MCVRVKMVGCPFVRDSNRLKSFLPLSDFLKSFLPLSDFPSPGETRIPTHPELRTGTGAQTLRVQKKVTILWPQQTSQLRARTHWGSGRCPRSDAFAYSEAPPRNQA